MIQWLNLDSVVRLVTMERVFLDEVMHLELSEQARSEHCVAEYFLRRGWQVERIAEDAQKRPDWFISLGDTQLLCEVKTISSARRGDHPEDIFDTNFRNPVLAYFQRGSFRNLPYSIALHNNTMTAPSKEEAIQFAEWLGEAVLKIDQSIIPIGWECVHHHFGVFYAATYTFASGRPNGTPNTLDIHLSREFHAARLHIMIPAYGSINSGPLQDRVRKAIRQLDDEAMYRKNLALPRVITIALRDGIRFDWSVTIDQLRNLLCRYSQLSAIAIFHWTPETHHLDTRWFLSFVVLHNQQSQHVNPLPALVFEDGYAKQHYDLEELAALAKAARL